MSGHRVSFRTGEAAPLPKEGFARVSSMQRVDWRIPAAWLTLCVVWSSTWLAIKIGLRDLPPVSFVAIRFLIATVVLVAVSMGRVRLLPLVARDYWLLAITGILMFGVNYLTVFWGELNGWCCCCKNKVGPGRIAAPRARVRRTQG